MQSVLAVALLVLVTGVLSKDPDSCTKGSVETNDPGCNKVVRGTNWPGNDITHILHVQSWQDCCERCKDYGDLCKAYIYYPDRNECFPKYVAGSPTADSAAYGRNEFEEDPPAECNAVIGKTRQNHDYMEVAVAQPGDCCDLCFSNPKCVAWTWNRSRGRCYLKDDAADYLDAIDCVSGDKPKSGDTIQEHSSAGLPQ